MRMGRICWMAMNALVIVASPVFALDRGIVPVSINGFRFFFLMCGNPEITLKW